MRLDKFLKVSRLIKRRTVAKDSCEGGMVLLNNKPAKAGSIVKEGDKLELKWGERSRKYEILELKANAGVAEAREMYRECE